MAVNNRELIAGRYAANVQTTQYTAVNLTTVIDKFTVTNVTTNNVKFSAHVVESGGAAGATNRFIDSRTIGPGETYPCPELVGRVLESGGFISTLAGAASSLVIGASGREITPTST